MRNKTAAAVVHGRGMQDAVALAFARCYGETFRYVAKWNRWLEWDGVRWRFEDTLNAFDKARALLRASSDGAAKADAKTVAAVVTLARADRLIAATHEQWDADPWLLGTPKGTVDLRTGELGAASPDDYITKITAVAPDRNCPTPLWRKFLDRVTNGDRELQRYLQRVCGYALTGDISEEALFFSYGTGANGKGTFWETAARILRDYHKVASMGMFLWSAQDRHPTEMASLQGARLVTAMETQHGRHWDEEKVKALTGGDTISARFMRQDPFQFVPQFKLAPSGNHRPRIRNVDEGIRRRMNLIPWLVTIGKGERDGKLKQKLKREWPGILAWMIEGSLEWQRLGLAPPPAVVGATEEYLAAEDTLGQWLTERCRQGADKWVATDELFRSWKLWCARAREWPGSKNQFAQKLVERAFTLRKYGGQRGVAGLELKQVVK
jgi:putative DNA primase/helicase